MSNNFNKIKHGIIFLVKVKGKNVIPSSEQQKKHDHPP